MVACHGEMVSKDVRNPGFPDLFPTSPHDFKYGTPGASLFQPVLVFTGYLAGFAARTSSGVKIESILGDD
jgi:hypothetical protein